MASDGQYAMAQDWSAPTVAQAPPKPPEPPPCMEGELCGDGELQAWRDANMVRLQILDEGEGIPADDLNRVFDKFYRARKSDSQRAGTGLGLAICRGFVEAMGGSVDVANRNDRPGAVFSIAIPVPEDAGKLDTAA